MAILSIGQQVRYYTVQNLIKENDYVETYRVIDKFNRPFFMKAFVMSKVGKKLVNNATGRVREIEHSAKLDHENIIKFKSSGTITVDGGEVQYYTTNYLLGEILDTFIHKQEGGMSEEYAVSIYRGILNGLKYMHSNNVCHNDITPRNIMLSEFDVKSPYIIDLSHIDTFGSTWLRFDTSDLCVYYMANETFMGNYSPKSDLYAATAILYEMLTGTVLWHMAFPKNTSNAYKAMQIKKLRKENPIDFDTLPYDKNTIEALRHGLALNADDRASSADELLRILDGEKPQPVAKKEEKQEKTANNIENESFEEEGEKEKGLFDGVKFDIRRGDGNGFEDIAGMKDLKEYLYTKVIYFINDREKAKKYRITPPNGMLLYGPPGCGKTYVAEKFAEETNANYILIKSSDLASSYIHGSQQIISKLFKQAEAAAPIVICFDEFDALVPNRTERLDQMVSGEVNEFLSQLNNCSHRGIFVVATSNRPDKIDPAVMRTGRIDKLVYVPLPDLEARIEMFKMHIKDRPYNPAEIDFEKLGSMTENYIASDIAFIVNDAAMVAAFGDRDITQQLLEQSINNNRASLTPGVIADYESLRSKMDGVERRDCTPRIGFVK